MLYVLYCQNLKKNAASNACFTSAIEPNPGLAKVGYQGQLHSTETKKKYADHTYKSKKVIEFNVQLTKGRYTNFQNVHLCFPLKFRLASNNDNNIAAGLITVNNFLLTVIN